VHALIRDGYYAGRSRAEGRAPVSHKTEPDEFLDCPGYGDTDAYADLHPPANWWKDYNFIDAGYYFTRCTTPTPTVNDRICQEKYTDLHH